VIFSTKFHHHSTTNHQASLHAASIHILAQIAQNFDLVLIEINLVKA
jgi:hypothetical protein